MSKKSYSRYVLKTGIHRTFPERLCDSPVWWGPVGPVVGEYGGCEGQTVWLTQKQFAGLFDKAANMLRGAHVERPFQIGHSCQLAGKPMLMSGMAEDLASRSMSRSVQQLWVRKRSNRADRPRAGEQNGRLGNFTEPNGSAAGLMVRRSCA